MLFITLYIADIQSQIYIVSLILLLHVIAMQGMVTDRLTGTCLPDCPPQPSAPFLASLVPWPPPSFLLLAYSTFTHGRAWEQGYFLATLTRLECSNANAPGVLTLAIQP